MRAITLSRGLLVPFTTFLLGLACPATAAPEVRVSESYGKLPLHFEANQGQTHKDVRFLSRGPGYSLYLTAGEAVLVLAKPNSDGTLPKQGAQGGPDADVEAQAASVALRMALVGANHKPLVSGREELPGKANYFIGRDSSKWRTNVPIYARVHYREVYPGIDLVYYGNQRELEYDFVVAPGADPKKIVLGFKGADKLEIDAQGDLVLHAAGGAIRQKKPLVYQDVDGVRQEIAGRYVRKGVNRIGFKVAAYDASRPLVIDPVLAYSTYLGGSGDDYGSGIAVDAGGNAYVTGLAAPANFPTTAGAFQPVFRGFGDVFVTKLNAAGSALVYSTYLGGTDHEHGEKIAIDAAGNAYVTGHTRSTDFPTTPGAFQVLAGGLDDVFVAKLNSTGSALGYSTYLGGSGIDFGLAIAVDADGNAHVTGYTDSRNFPTTVGAFQDISGGGNDAFVTKLNPTGSAPVYSTYLGGTGEDYGRGIAVDASGNAYTAGSTDSPDFPTTPGAYRRSFAGGWDDPFVTKLGPGGGVVYSTYLGGSSYDLASGIAVDASGNAYIVGSTWSRDFPTTLGAFQPIHGGGTYDGYVIKLDPAGSTLVYATYLGGIGVDYGQAIAVDADGNAYVTGNTYSADFPTTQGAFQPVFGGGSDAYVTQLNPTGSALVYSTYLGGGEEDWGASIALDSSPSPNAYVAGYTASTNFPATNAIQAAYAGGPRDAFVAKFGDTAPAANSGTPFSGTPIAIPGAFEAEDFDRGGEGVAYHDNVRGNAGGQYRTSEDVDIIVSSDSAGGGYVVTNTETGEWLAYTINVTTSGNYDIELRAATNWDFPNAAYHAEIDGVDVTGSVILPNTGGWSTFQWVGKNTVSLSAGTHVLKIVVDRQYFSLNSIRVLSSSAAGPTLYSGGPYAIPGTFEAEDFDRGGEGVGYHDNVRGNAGGQYRTSEDVDIIVSSDSAGGGYVVTNTETGEWLAYTIKVATSGNYDIELRAATSWDFPNAAYHAEIDGVNVTGSVVLPNTGGWSTFWWVGKKTVSLSAGTHVLKIVVDRQYFSLNSIRVLSSPIPYSGAPIAIPGTFEAENFDRGGEGVGYHDNVRGNAGGQYRTSEDVDIIVSSDSAGGGYVVTNTETGEWLAYTINVARGGQYDIELRAATSWDFPNAAYHAEIDGVNVTGTVILPDTGGWSTFQWVGKKTVSLSAGTHVLKIVIDRQYFSLNSVRVVTTPPMSAGTVLFFCTFANSPTDCGFNEQARAWGRASIVNIGRDGPTAVRLRTEPGDNNVAGSQYMERNDLWLSQALSDGYEGRESWWAHSILFPDDFVIPSWHMYVVADFHHTGCCGQANFHVNFENGAMTFRGFGGSQDSGLFRGWIGPITKNVWYDFVYHVKWSSGPDGFFDAWVNGVRKLSHKGPTMYAGEGVYFKLANYHVPVCDPYPNCWGPASSVIHDRVVRGTTPLAVSLGPLEGVLGLVNGILTPLP